MVTAISSPSVANSIAKPPLLRTQAPRLVSVDVLRGLVMVLMALDHVRDFLSYQGFPPEDMAHTNGPLFFTRVITHFCAPVFASWPEPVHSSRRVAGSRYGRSHTSF
jgi:uncharacterized membrane protein